MPLPKDLSLRPSPISFLANALFAKADGAFVYSVATINMSQSRYTDDNSSMIMTITVITVTIHRFLCKVLQVEPVYIIM